MENPVKKEPLITSHMDGVEKQKNSIEQDLRDSVMLLRRGLRFLPEEFKLQVYDWLQRKTTSSLLREEPYLDRIAQNDPELFPWLMGVLHPSRKAGATLSNLSESALRADAENYSLMRPTLLAFKDKYHQYYDDELARMIRDGYDPDSPDNKPMIRNPIQEK